MQQINLYLPEFRPQVDLLSASRAAIFIAALLVLILGLHLYRANQLSAANAAVVELEQQQKTLKEQADALKKSPKPVKDADLERQVEELRQAIGNREGVAKMIANRSLGNDTGFSRHLLALGQHKVEGVSLEEFTLQSGGAFLHLAGVSQKPELVPLYISQLQEDDSFNRTKFGYLSLRNQGTAVRFLLSGDGPVEEGALTGFNDGQFNAIPERPGSRVR